ncbi:ATPase [Clostridium sp. YIM B02505]|uniref:ATPase n=2 Tax=Clostridium yunnanense TaxID=2800325 RepID=A0ABS1EMR5_9CLOT|nr:ATPase [Clostridium yunnanense]MBK1810625.1 ATPase [Clostridium yunnanense]
MEVNVIELLEYLQDIVESAAKVPITGKVVVDKKEVLEVVDQVINYLPDEFKKAQWVMTERERILGEAQKEYENVKKQTMDLLKKQVENHDIVKEANIRAQEIIASAQREAKAIRIGARDYADEILSQLEKEIEVKTKEILNIIKTNVETLATNMNDDMNKTAVTIRENIKELRSIK